jgi:hypothetical protein
MPEPSRKTFGVQPDVLKLGFVSFLTDLSSEMIFSVFAIFFTTIAGGSSALLGVVEGCADFSASSLNYVAGWRSDRSGKRKVFAIAGYGFSTLAKVILLVASSVVSLSIFRVIERLGKGFRGPLVAYGLLSWMGETAATFRILFWAAFVPAVLSVLVLGLMKDRPGVQYERENLFAAWKTLSPGFKRYLVTAGIFSLGYFSFGFLLLRAYDVFFSVDEAQSKAFIADLEPERRATAVGVYGLVTGVIYLPASLIAGALWAVHASVVFILAALLSLAAIAALVILPPARGVTDVPGPPR